MPTIRNLKKNAANIATNVSRHILWIVWCYWSTCCDTTWFLGFAFWQSWELPCKNETKQNVICVQLLRVLMIFHDLKINIISKDVMHMCKKQRKRILSEEVVDFCLTWSLFVPLWSFVFILIYVVFINVYFSEFVRRSWFWHRRISCFNTGLLPTTNLLPTPEVSFSLSYFLNSGMFELLNSTRYHE